MARGTLATSGLLGRFFNVVVVVVEKVTVEVEQARSNKYALSLSSRYRRLSLDTAAGEERKNSFRSQIQLTIGSEFSMQRGQIACYQ